jgi:hypothetical protein
MGKPDFEIAYENIPVLAVCFTRTENPICNAIRFFRGGKKAVDDLAFPNHCFPVSESWGQKYACEETIKGLVENSMEKYRYKKERIVACYYWTGWHDKEVREMALERLAYIRRKQGDKTTKLGKYNPLGLGRFLPVIGKWKIFNKDSEADWCSENTASIHMLCGANFIKDKHIAPDQLLKAMQSSKECKAILNYYRR